MISARGITKNYGDFCAVDNISFSIKDGEITGLLGPNGAGKTTTLRMLTCYLEPDGGTVEVGDFLADRDPLEIKKVIGYLPESAPLYGDMLVYDYLAYVAEVRGISHETRIPEIAELCGITEVMHKTINELSKGYKQRVGLAHAMMHDPDILILDEPTSGLDPNQIIEIRNLIKEIGKKKTVILSTHILSEVEATCDRVIIIDRGKIIADDRTENLQGRARADRQVSVSVEGCSSSELVSALKEIPGVVSAEETETSPLTSVLVSSRGDDDVRPEIFKLVCKNNWVLYEIKQEQQSLESVFRELTQGGNNE